MKIIILFDNHHAVQFMINLNLEGSMLTEHSFVLFFFTYNVLPIYITGFIFLLYHSIQ